MKKFLTIPLFLLLAGCNTATGTNTQVMNDSTKTLLIDSQLYDCVGVAPMKCMKVFFPFIHLHSHVSMQRSFDIATHNIPRLRMLRIINF